MSGRTDATWFAAKTHGYGAGLPIEWQGWVVLLGSVLVIILAAVFLKGWRQVVAIVLSAAVLLVIAYFTTEGGWEWRG